MGAEADIIAHLTSRYFGLRAFGDLVTHEQLIQIWRRSFSCFFALKM
jgi:hypothetical protein